MLELQIKTLVCNKLASADTATVTHARNKRVPCKYEVPSTALINPLRVLCEQGVHVWTIYFHLNI
jgi:hypothetical protein